MKYASIKTIDESLKNLYLHTDPEIPINWWK